MVTINKTAINLYVIKLLFSVFMALIIQDLRHVSKCPSIKLVHWLLIFVMTYGT